MIEQKHPAHSAFVLVICITLSAYSSYRLYEYLTLESLQHQINSNFLVIYLSTSHVISVSGLILAPTLSVFIASRVIFKSSSVSIKWMGFATVLALLVAIPGRLWEFGRLQNIAETNGYLTCPPFTIASSGMFVEAMVKEEKYCIEPEINRIGMYGYFHELERIDNYIKSHRNDIQ
ncbi:MULTISPECIES: hypothetical protein [Vibrio]|uniref:hypothetical protein n=2 Tax=Vibrio TaxID=662 RepID=UPI0006A76A5F|nr:MULTISPECIES: hypothetical protein [Vibrio]ANP64931.1 hypothetical protein BAU10_07980 [Vibrio alginolyticus]MCA2419591.1 hypothetical protein [Vibrio alginolyticus]MCA2444217.1 hypothetical protein [Vibrio alginolyticus]MCG6355937.1 hypothetical protein [Vibrio alginolyticus]MCR9637680.1 hypothetical protein [Vibrio alginolyticus]